MGAYSVTFLIVTLGIAGCLTIDTEVSNVEIDKNVTVDSEISNFEVDKNISGRVIENINGCIYDALCYLKIEFADQEIEVIYQYGWKPPCAIPPEVYGPAGGTVKGDIIELEISSCDDVYLIQRIETNAPPATINFETSCQTDEDCRYLISHNTCELFCVNSEIFNDLVASNLAETCDSSTWDPPFELRCDCDANNCELSS